MRCYISMNFAANVAVLRLRNLIRHWPSPTGFFVLFRTALQLSAFSAEGEEERLTLQPSLHCSLAHRGSRAVSPPPPPFVALRRGPREAGCPHAAMWGP